MGLNPQIWKPWAGASGNLRPQAGEILVWRARVPPGEGLPPDEMARLCRMRARSLLEGILSWVCGVAVGDLNIERDAFGRPFIRECKFDFNLSHSGRWICIALREGGRVGIDIERHRASREIGAIAKRFFSPEEALRVRPDDAGVSDIAEFYRLWTTKEAVLKALGTGLSGGLHSICPEWTAHGGFHVIEPGGESFEGVHLHVADGYEAALAWSAKHPYLSLSLFDNSEISLDSPAVQA